MARYFFDRKTTVEEAKSISIFDLKKWRVFKQSFSSGKLTWNLYGNESSVSYSFDKDESILRLQYSFNDPEDPKAKQDYKIHLCTTPCNYGGKRYWFYCPKCNKRVGKLFLAGKYIFACRHCWNLSYNSRNFSGFERSVGKTLSYPELDEMRMSMKRTHYNGKATKRYKKWLEYSNKLERAFSFITNKYR